MTGTRWLTRTNALYACMHACTYVCIYVLAEAAFSQAPTPPPGAGCGSTRNLRTYVRTYRSKEVNHEERTPEELMALYVHPLTLSHSHSMHNDSLCTWQAYCTCTYVQHKWVCHSVSLCYRTIVSTQNAHSTCDIHTYVCMYMQYVRMPHIYSPHIPSTLTQAWGCKYVCMYVCMYVRTHVCMCVCVCVYVCTYIRMYVCIFVGMQVVARDNCQGYNVIH